MHRAFVATGLAALLISVASPVLADPALAAPRVIVRFRAGSAKAYFTTRAHVARVADDLQVGLRYVRPMALGLAVVESAADSTPEGLAAALASHPDVEWAEADVRVQPRRVPGDAFNGGQTYLANGPTAIDAYAAWDVTTGSPGTVVAVLDTGYRPHPDLAGRILPGYDFITDPAVANDGDGRDPDASDPGDWVTSAEATTAAFSGCAVGNSSWHGTGVAGVIAANTDNGAWIAGIDWNAKILPVRVLGKCGGYTSDIVDGIAWAGGLAVPGIRANATPAGVINLSFGGRGACGASYGNVIQAVLAAGFTKAIVVAAGNDAEDVANDMPANCPEVITVASTTSAGSLAGYSNSGSGITLAAPGGQYGANVADAGVLALSNAGATTPTADSLRSGGGTSYAAPMVSGVIALLLGIDPALTAAEVRSILVSTAKPFPSNSNCTSMTCGAGIVSAFGAVTAALALIPARTTVTVVEYYHRGLDRYFITWVPAEIAALDGGAMPGWQRTGASFNAYASAQPGTSPVCRYYIPPAYGDSHFFGRGTSECAETSLQHPAFTLESGDFMDMFLPVNGTCTPPAVPVYRVFSNRPDANHRYTTDPVTRDALVALGWLAEGDGPDRVVMCAPP